VTRYEYRPDLAVERYDLGGGKKTFQPWFYQNDEWHVGAGAEIWPFYGTVGQEDQIIEVEGEKCVHVLRSQGIASLTHPGHQRDETSCIARYKGLAQAGIKKVIFISDNDKPGRAYAAKFCAWAQQAGIEFKVLPAEEIWSELPDAGSVDDMPAEQLSTLIPAALAAKAGVKPASITRVSHDKVRQELQALYDGGPETIAGIAAAIADIASANGITTYDAKRIWDSLEEDHQIATEASSGAQAILNRQALQDRRNTISLKDYLPDSVCQSVETLVTNLSCDPLTAISVVLTTVSGALKTGHRIDAGDGLFVKEPVMWTLLAGPSGSGKSPIMRHLCRDRMRLVLNHYSAISDQVLENFYKMYADIPKNKKLEEPEPLATCITDFTTESLNRIVVDNHQNGLGTFMYSEEVKEIIGNFDEYKAGGKGRGKETLLCLFDGNVNAQHRLSRKTKIVNGKVQNALLGGVQPGVFRTMVEKGDDAGLYARCLVIPIPQKFVEPDFCRSTEQLAHVHNAERNLENFYLRAATTDPIVMRLSPEAVNMFSSLAADTHRKQLMVTLDSQRAVYGKRLGYVLQVALTMHVASVAAKECSQDERYLSLATLAKAVKFVDLLQAYAVLEQQESQMQSAGSFDLPRRIHNFAKARGGVTAREFMNSCVGSKLRKIIKTPQVRVAMEQLVLINLGKWSGSGKGQTFVACGEYPD
jgi:hypothetical protein